MQLLCLKRKYENSKTVQSEQHKNTVLCDHCENLFKTENNLQMHKESMHVKIRWTENIEQLDGQTEVEDSEDE